MTTNKHIYREAWLTAGMEMLDNIFFAGNGHELPGVRVSVGFPKSSATAIGQCWARRLSGDNTYEIFICPTMAEPNRVLDILLHEMIHVSVGLEEGHRGKFRQLAKEFGLAGKMTATIAAEGSELWNTLQNIACDLGDYPHAPLEKTRKRTKRDNGWTRYKSVIDQTYKAITNDAKVAEFGAPVCPWGAEMVPNTMVVGE